MIYIVTIVGVALVGILVILLKKRHDEFERKIHETYSNKNTQRIDKAVFLAAQESRGLSQTQGLGYLILTDSCLYFEMQPIDKTIEIPLSSILNVGETYRMGGKSTGKRWLKIEYKINDENDALALSVKKLDEWQKDLQQAIKENV